MFKYNTPDNFGKNKSLIDKFKDQKYYDLNLFKKDYYPYQLDNWNQNKYYGLIDLEGDFVSPNTDYFKPVPMDVADNQDILTFDFIIEAFKDLKAYYSSFSMTNKLAKDYTNLNNFRIKSGYKSSDKEFLDFIRKIYTYFQEQHGLKQKLSSFDEYIKELVNAFELICLTDLPLTQLGFLQSRFSDIRYSGLVLSFEDLGVDNSDKLLKYNKYINNPNFSALADSCARYGFIIDRNAPWNLIADINSPVMQNYMQNYGCITMKDYFRLRTTKVKYSDIHTLKTMVLSFYNTLAANQPTITQEIKVDKTCADYKYIHIVNQRLPISERLLLDKYDDSFFVRLYCFVKFKESKLQLNQNEFDKIVLNAQKINKYQNEEAAINYISTFIKPKLTEKSLPLTSDQEIGKILSTLKKDQIRPTFKF